LTGDPGMDLWISSLVASRANHTASPASAEGPPTSVIFGPTSGGSFARWDPDSCSWRTYQGCLALTEEQSWAAYSGTWPRAGMTRSGTAYRLRPCAPLTGGIGCGLLPTPAAHQMGSNTVMRAKGETCRSRILNWPTPTAADVHVLGTSRQVIARADRLGQTVHLAQRVRWPTPKSSPSGPDFARASRPGSGGDDLATAVARDPQAGGSLNPDFAAWLMGWPRGWDNLEPLAYKPGLSDTGDGDYNAPEKTHAGEILPVLRDQAGTEAIREDPGKPECSRATILLQPDLYGNEYETAQSNAGGFAKEVDEAAQRHLPDVRDDRQAADTPREREPGRQLPSEPDDIVCFLSREMALAEWEGCAEATVGLHRLRAACAQAGYVSEALSTLQEIWQSLPHEAAVWTVMAARGGPWVAEWPGVPRLADNVTHRVDRLRTIGNGWVPQVAAVVAGRIGRRLLR
jgi:hypothetical protein